MNVVFGRYFSKWRFLAEHTPSMYLYSYVLFVARQDVRKSCKERRNVALKIIYQICAVTSLSRAVFVRSS
jgi:hypothetical protein